MELIPEGEGYVVQGREEKRKMLRGFFALKGKSRWFIACGLGELGKGGRLIVTCSKTSISIKFHALSSQHEI